MLQTRLLQNNPREMTEQDALQIYQAIYAMSKPTLKHANSLSSLTIQTRWADNDIYGTCQQCNLLQLL